MYERVFYKKPLANIILNGKNFTPKIENKARISFLIRLFSIALEILASTIRQAKEIKGMQIEKEEIKLFYLQT